MQRRREPNTKTDFAVFLKEETSQLSLFMKRSQDRTLKNRLERRRAYVVEWTSRGKRKEPFAEPQESTCGKDARKSFDENKKIQDALKREGTDLLRSRDPRRKRSQVPQNSREEDSSEEDGGSSSAREERFADGKERYFVKARVPANNSFFETLNKCIESFSRTGLIPRGNRSKDRANSRATWKYRAERLCDIVCVTFFGVPLLELTKSRDVAEIHSWFLHETYCPRMFCLKSEDKYDFLYRLMSSFFSGPKSPEEKKLEKRGNFDEEKATVEEKNATSETSKDTRFSEEEEESEHGELLNFSRIPSSNALEEFSKSVGREGELTYEICKKKYEELTSSFDLKSVLTWHVSSIIASFLVRMVTSDYKWFSRAEVPSEDEMRRVTGSSFAYLFEPLIAGTFGFAWIQTKLCSFSQQFFSLESAFVSEDEEKKRSTFMAYALEYRGSIFPMELASHDVFYSRSIGVEAIVSRKKEGDSEKKSESASKKSNDDEGGLYQNALKIYLDARRECAEKRGCCFGWYESNAETGFHCGQPLKAGTFFEEEENGRVLLEETGREEVVKVVTESPRENGKGDSSAKDRVTETRSDLSFKDSGRGNASALVVTWINGNTLGVEHLKAHLVFDSSSPRFSLDKRGEKEFLFRDHSRFSSFCLASILENIFSGFSRESVEESVPSERCKEGPSVFFFKTYCLDLEEFQFPNTSSPTFSFDNAFSDSKDAACFVLKYDRKSFVESVSAFRKRDSLLKQNRRTRDAKDGKSEEKRETDEDVISEWVLKSKMFDMVYYLHPGTCDQFCGPADGTTATLGVSKVNFGRPELFEPRPSVSKNSSESRGRGKKDEDDGWRKERLYFTWYWRSPYKRETIDEEKFLRNGGARTFPGPKGRFFKHRGSHDDDQCAMSALEESVVSSVREKSSSYGVSDVESVLFETFSGSRMLGI